MKSVHGVSTWQRLGYRLGKAWRWQQRFERRAADRVAKMGGHKAGSAARWFFTILKLTTLVGVLFFSVGFFVMHAVVLVTVLGRTDKALPGSTTEEMEFPYDINGNHVGDIDYMSGQKDRW